jgi:hypothetical protein
MNAIFSIHLQRRCIVLNGTEKAAEVFAYARRLQAVYTTKEGEVVGVQLPGQTDQFLTSEELVRTLEIKIVKK